MLKSVDGFAKFDPWDGKPQSRLGPKQDSPLVMVKSVHPNCGNTARLLDAAALMECWKRQVITGYRCLSIQPHTLNVVGSKACKRIVSHKWPQLVQQPSVAWIPSEAPHQSSTLESIGWQQCTTDLQERKWGALFSPRVVFTKYIVHPSYSFLAQTMIPIVAIKCKRIQPSLETLAFANKSCKTLKGGAGMGREKLTARHLLHSTLKWSK